MFGRNITSRIDEVTENARDAADSLAIYGRQMTSILGVILAVCAATLLIVTISEVRRAS